MRVYDEVLVPRLFVPWGRVLLDELDLVPGKAVLDLACGPGSVTRLAAEHVGPNGHVTGCDFSPAMLELARAKPGPPGAAQIEYLEAPADDLPVAARSFDVAVCQQGLQFFPDRPAALAEMHRALRPGGSVGIAVWSKIGDSPVFAAMYDAIREAIDDELADRYRAGPSGFEPRRLGRATRRRRFRRHPGRASDGRRHLRGERRNSPARSPRQVSPRKSLRSDRTRKSNSPVPSKPAPRRSR